jgi:3-oxoacyl-(acyl-carrier-protein) synthase
MVQEDPVTLSPRADPVVIVAAGAVTSIGADLETFWSGLVDGRDGISAIERFRVDDLRVGRAGEIKHVALAPGAPVPECRASLLLLAAAEDLLRRCPLDAEPSRIGVVVGTALGGVGELEHALDKDSRVSRTAAALYDSPGRALARRLGARGPELTAIWCAWGPRLCLRTAVSMRSFKTVPVP